MVDLKIKHNYLTVWFVLLLWFIPNLAYFHVYDSFGHPDKSGIYSLQLMLFQKANVHQVMSALPYHNTVLGMDTRDRYVW